MATTTSHILRIPRTDTTGDDAFVLGHVSASGSKPLNLKFAATEGEEPYVVKCDLMASSSSCPPDEWEKILKFILLGQEPVDGIEAGAEVHVGKSITVKIQRRVAGINQRLGAITLTHKADEAIQLYDWCGLVARDREKLKSDLTAETLKIRELEARVTELKNLLDELTQAKKDSETEMLEKFRLLLNEKKVKIREQQKVLATAQIDPSKLAAIQAAGPVGSPSSPQTSKGRVPRGSRAGKRKTRTAESSDDSDDGFEKMDVDKRATEPPPSATLEEGDESMSDDAQQTQDEDATASDSEPGDEQPLPSPSRYQRKKPAETRRRITRATASPPPARASKGKEKELAVHTRRTPTKSPTPSPAKAAVQRHQAAAPQLEGSETESDDEL
ncbi:hypothetical protein OQA88_12200 [Cercophora sp. LCS_1]